MSIQSQSITAPKTRNIFSSIARTALVLLTAYLCTVILSTLLDALFRNTFILQTPTQEIATTNVDSILKYITLALIFLMFVQILKKNYQLIDRSFAFLGLCALTILTFFLAAFITGIQLNNGSSDLFNWTTLQLLRMSTIAKLISGLVFVSSLDRLIETHQLRYPSAIRRFLKNIFLSAWGHTESDIDQLKRTAERINLITKAVENLDEDTQNKVVEYAHSLIQNKSNEVIA